MLTNTTWLTGIVGRIPYESTLLSPGPFMDQHLLIPGSHHNDDGYYATSPADVAADGDDGVRLCM